MGSMKGDKATKAIPSNAATCILSDLSCNVAMLELKKLSVQSNHHAVRDKAL